MTNQPNKDLSPITKGVIKAFEDRYELCGPFDGNWVELCLAAVFRELAELGGIESIFVDPSGCPSEKEYGDLVLKRAQTRFHHLIISIADELENHVPEK